MIISYEEFERVDLRCGTIIKVEDFPKARKAAYKIWVDFGAEIGIKKTSAQVTIHYTPESLLGRLIVGCINLGTRNIGGFTSEFLLIGLADEQGAVCLLTADKKVPNGQKLF
jgi:tRNA-binding protein